MSFQSEPKQSDIVKILERQNVISFKKKSKFPKDNLKSQNNNEDEDNVSAQSSHSGVYSQDVNRFKGKINPLPELGKQKKRFISKNLLAQQFRITNYQQKEVRQQENLMLKQKNNFLSCQNMKLRTKVTTLEKENIKLQKMFEEEPSKPKTPGLGGIAKERFRSFNQNLSTKMLIKSLKKQLQDLKKQNSNIKSSIKFTTISELEVERDEILEQTNRLRSMLEEQQSKRINMKINQQGMSNLQQKLTSVHQQNSILLRQNNDLKSKLKSLEDGQTKANKPSENEKHLNKALYNIRRLLKQKQKQIQILKEQIKGIGSVHSMGVVSDQILSIPQHNNLMQVASNMHKKSSVERSQLPHKSFQKRLAGKSAQKNGPRISQKQFTKVECQQCKLLRSQNELLKKKLLEYETAFQASNPLTLPSEPVQCPRQQQIKSLTRFIQFRFKAHHLGLNESEKYLLNVEAITQQELSKQMSVEQFLQIVVTEPFVVLNKRYIEVFLMQICYFDEISKGAQKIKINKDNKITKKTILTNYKKLVLNFELLPQSKEEEMFLQIAELVTSYYQQILAAMSTRKNGDGTISQKDLTDFFTQIQLEKQYIDFIITQIILESIDLDRLNYFAFFEIFYIPQEETDAVQIGQSGKKLLSHAPADKKKRFEVDQVVKQEDEQYEQSRSHVGQSRQKTISKQAQESGDSYHQLNSDDSPAKRQLNKQNYEQDEQDYGQQYDEQSQKLQGIKIQKQNNQPMQQSSKIKTEKQKQKPHQTNKTQSRNQSYAEQFEQEKINLEIQQNQHQKYGQKKLQITKKTQKLTEKSVEIEDIEDEYQEQFD